MPSSRGSSQPRERTSIAGGFFTMWATRVAYSPGWLPIKGSSLPVSVVEWEVMPAHLVKFNTRLWCWEGLRAGGEGDDRGWDAWMASLTPCTWVLVNSGSSWWTGRPGVLRFMGLQRVGHVWATDLIWSDLNTRDFSRGIVKWKTSLNGIIFVTYSLLSWIALNKCRFK